MKQSLYLILIALSISVFGCNKSDDVILLPEAPSVPEDNDEDNDSSPSPNDDATLENNTETLRIKITIGNNTVTATLYNNATAKDFLTQLPLTVTLEDYASTEKIFYLPNNYRLSTDGAPNGYNPSLGDITLYAPWGNIAIFYRDFGYSSGLVSIGKIDGEGVAHFQTSGSLVATFEKQSTRTQ